MKEITLTQGKVALVDDDVFEYLNQWKWHYQKVEKTGYAIRSEGPKHHQRFILMHRVIMNTPSDQEVDHADHEGCNNQRYNMRNCTHASNMQNRTKQIGNTSGYKGVYFYKRDKKWVASISLNDNIVYLGRFTTPEDAARAYDKAALEHYGEFALLNGI